MTTTVREAVVPAVTLDAGATVAEALARLEQAGATFAVLRDEQGGLRGPIPVETLKKVKATESRLADMAIDAPSPIFAPPGISIDQVARLVAKDLVLNPRLAGVVVKEGDQVLGVLTRQFLAQSAARLTTRGTTDRMEGAPVDILYFECPKDGERQLVAYYDPQHPPTCSQGHRMQPVD